jgi:flavin reductase (DIM6/NTAB) family NADH-FMN oxidoreductase RutF
VVKLGDLEGHSADRLVVFGQVIGVYIDDGFIKNGRLDTAAMAPIARCGYADYAVIDRVITIVRPRMPEPAKPHAAE